MKRPLFAICILILSVIAVLSICGIFPAYDSSSKDKSGLCAGFLQYTRDMWEKRLYEVFPEQEGGILCDLLLGDKDAISDEIKDLYSRNGIAHILSISGLHISILGAGLYGLLRKSGVPVPAAALCAGIFLVFYGVMTGMSVSARRSIYMFIMKLMADSIGRTVDKPTSFALVAVLVLIPEPSLMNECSYLLSFGSAAGIYFLAPVLSEHIKHLLSGSKRISLWIRTHNKSKKYMALHGLVNSLIMSTSVTLTILPVTLWFFYEYPVWSTLLNLIVLPLMTLLVVSALLAMLIPGTGLLGTPAYLILKFFEWICGLFDKLPFHNWNPGRPPVLGIVIYYLVWLTVVLFPVYSNKIRMHKRWIKFAKLCKPHHLNSYPIICLLLCLSLFSFPKLPKNSLIMLDVGQGDGFIFHTDARDVYLIDGGSSSKKNVGKYVIKDTLKRFGLSHIDAAFVSHPDTDHLSGLIEIMENRDRWGFKIDEVVLPGCIEEDMNAYVALHNLNNDQSAEGLHNFIIITDLATSPEYKNSIVIGYVCAGDEWESGRNNFVCLHPSKDFKAADPNEMSECFLVNIFDDRNINLLLTGDVQGEGEIALTEKLLSTETDITVLKTAHHGSKYSTTESFLSAANPQIALISAGIKNRYGHPHKEVIERLKERNVHILNTQECGSVLLTVRKSGLRCRCF